MANAESQTSGITGEPSEIYSALFDLWSIQNSILQSFRAVFIASETFILAFAALASGGAEPSPERCLVLLFGIGLGVTWTCVCWDRGYNDSYCRHQILKLEREELTEQEKRVLASFREFQERCFWQKRKNLRRKVGASRTRWFLDFGLPAIYITSFVCFLRPCISLLG